MKAWQIERFGLENLELVERPCPSPGPGEILVRVRAVSLNYRDRLVVSGSAIPKLRLPFTPASDASGEVADIGAGVTRFKPGDHVVSHYVPRWIDGDGRSEGDYRTLGGPLSGVLSEYVVFSEQSVVPPPASYSDEEASTLPIAAVTAWTALFVDVPLKPGETVLVEGTGGVSIFAMQFARAAGARVIVTSSSDGKIARAKALGASDGVNYSDHPEWSKLVLQLTGGRGVNHVIEVVGGRNLRQAAAALNRGGHIALVGLMGSASVEFDHLAFMLRRQSIHGILVGSRRYFEAAVRALETTGIRPVIDRIYPFEDARAAFDHLVRGPFGKVVISLAPKQ
jgi:NADPH:quinone reductase-like Zn-dependent oxidoreductase